MIPPIMSTEHFTFTPHLLYELKASHAAAIRRGAPTFIFHGHEVLVAYARYLIEYLEGRFEDDHPANQPAYNPSPKENT